jgi:Leucine-rich repeat (LRR) protein
VELGGLSSLQELNLSFSCLSGGIPLELGGLSSLQRLDFMYNNLSGAIPPELGELSNLQRLYLSGNQLSGNIPVELGGLSNLLTLYLDGNELDGDIPVEIGRLSNLLFLDLSYNQLSGSIPVELGGLSNLLYLYLDHNRLSGSIPLELGDLSNLVFLYLSGNRLSGSIPVELGGLSNLLSLILSDNQLSGSIPAELGGLSSLQVLYLGRNRLSGSVPSGLGDLPNLRNSSGLSLSWNALWTDDPTLDAFIDSKHSSNGDWQVSQTIAPVNVVATGSGDTTQWLSWDAVSYVVDGGGYEVLWAESPAGVWHSAGWTASKSETTFPVTGLAGGATYDFAIRTFTLPHANNQNTVESDLSSVETGTTGSVGCAAPSIAKTGAHPATLGVTGEFSTYDWSTGETTATVVVDPLVPSWYWVNVTWTGPCDETAAILVDPSEVFSDGFENGLTTSWSGAVGVAP